MVIPIVDVIIIKDNKILMVQELKKSAYGLWNFPGGKVEPDESLLQAAQREIREELNIELRDAKFLKTYTVKTGGADLELNVFTGVINGDIQTKNDEIMSYGWFSSEDIESMRDKLRGDIVIKQARDALYI